MGIPVPGFRHNVMLKLKPDTTAEAKDAILAGLAGLPAAIPQIKNYSFGVDAGMAEGNATITIVADFLSAEEYVVYRDHPVHLAVIAERIKPVLVRPGAVTPLPGAGAAPPCGGQYMSHRRRICAMKCQVRFAEKHGLGM
mmetsp:Transcript_32532/g.84293  ORF Transcript_32532/g.84293 Transcript_32532/m.84293 type:complete len:140 (-) Transcript_32532:190-609(-)